jgi:hypothetical protein
VHREKALSPINVTEAGMQIDLNDGYDVNDFDPISDSSDLNSNAIN